MSYQVIARKYRPQGFEEVIGQDAVTQTLKNAIASNRVHHAYLFCGARGIGKTSLARIFAKALNCVKGPTATPCQICPICLEITGGSSLDVREIDGASNTSVEDVREIREQLKYLPASAKYKIYIIDEVHMLSNNAFNALLKTLEEPPPHVIFMFATTESHKIPATILSRCQRFDLRRIPNDQVFEKLKEICEAEKINPSEDALRLIVRESGGSLRDSQSLLDQAIALTDGNLNLDSISSMLGLSNSSDIYQITNAVLTQSTEKALLIVHSIYEKGHDLKQFVTQWLEQWKNLLLYRATQSIKVLESLTETEKTELIKISQKAEIAMLDTGFHLLCRGVEEISRTEFPKMILEVLIVRLSHLSEIKSLSEILNAMKSGSSFSTTAPESTMRRSDPRVVAHPIVNQNIQSDVESREKGNSIDLPLHSIQKTERETEANSSKNSKLDLFIQHLSNEKPQIGSLLTHLLNYSMESETILFQFEPETIWMELLLERKSQIEEIATQFFQKPMKLILQNAPISEVKELKNKKIDEKKSKLDPIVNSALEILNAQIKEVNE